MVICCIRKYYEVTSYAWICGEICFFSKFTRSPNKELQRTCIGWIKLNCGWSSICNLWIHMEHISTYYRPNSINWRASFWVVSSQFSLNRLNKTTMIAAVVCEWFNMTFQAQLKDVISSYRIRSKFKHMHVWTIHIFM